MNIGVEEYFQREYNKCLQEADTEEEKKYVESFRVRKNIKNSIYMTKGNTTYCYKVEPLIDTLKDILKNSIF